MKIRRIHTDQIKNGSYLYWKQDVLSRHLENNYEILSPPDLVDVFMINIENGKSEFVDTTDRYIAQQQYLEVSDIYYIEDTTAEFDDKYRMTKRPKGADRMKFPDVFDLLDFDLSVKNRTMKSFEKIFISHSFKDKEIVEDLIDLLEVIGIKHEQIFCSSIQGYGISLGETETIKQIV